MRGKGVAAIEEAIEQSAKGGGIYQGRLGYLNLKADESVVVRFLTDMTDVITVDFYEFIVDKQTGKVIYQNVVTGERPRVLVLNGFFVFVRPDTGVETVNVWPLGIGFGPRGIHGASNASLAWDFGMATIRFSWRSISCTAAGRACGSNLASRRST